MSNQPEHLHRTQRPVHVAAIQMSCGWDADRNIAKAEELVREAARRGAQIILLPELFEAPYFCIEQDVRHPAARTSGHRKIVPWHTSVVWRASSASCYRSAFSSTPVRPISTPSPLSDAKWHKISASIGSRISRTWAWLPGEDVCLLARRHRLQSLGTPALRVLVLAFAGTRWFPETSRALALLGAEILFYPYGDWQ